MLVETADLSRDEWLEYRRKGIGGSDASAVLGISPFRTARDLYFDKLNIVTADDGGNWVAMEMGNLLEDLVARIFAKKTGLRIFQRMMPMMFPIRAKTARRRQISDTVFSYVVCCICPVKDGKPELGFFAGENEFHSCTASQIVAPPELGFLFPAFDDRAANLYNALFYSKKPDQIHQEFIDAVFHTEPPMSAAEQRGAFETALSDALEGACNMEVAQAVHERLRDQIVQHKESHDPEPLAVTAGEVGAILRSCSVPEEQVSCFLENCEEQFGKGAALDPMNLIDSGRFEVETSDAKISVDPERSYLVETRIIEGRAYLLIPAEGVTVNGLPVTTAHAGTAQPSDTLA